MIIVAENKVRYWDVHENYRYGNELLKSDDYKSRRNTPVDLIDGVGCFRLVLLQPETMK